ncbi:MAG: TIGR03617 family F420-dependent LLM class oxidoreductase [Caldilineaceae bacterium]|nr:TIGR03617 family F420-dependent LLM class oxidoreductase [Caldilineaceae bacterium]
MKFDASLWVDDLRLAPETARAAEDLGFDALWTSDVAHNPLFPLVLAAEHTERIQLGTAILVAFARSPMDVAYQAWDLAKLSNGRFMLGLGTQVSAHIERRFGMDWRTPADAHLREYIAALRAIWQSWQTGERLNHRGDFYKLTLMTPFFNPGPIDHPQIPIYTAGVNERMCRLAGEVSDGFHAHPFHTRRYLQEVVIPAIENGAKSAGRSRGDVQVSSAIFVATGADQAQFDAALAAVRQQVSFYASTPDYAAVMDLHGWSGVREELSSLAGRKEWASMPGLITDEMVDQFAIVCPPQQLASRIREKYAGILDRVTLYIPFDPKHKALWRLLLQR